MRRIKGTNLKKRVISAALAVVLIISMLVNSDWGMVAKADVSTKDETATYDGTTKTRVRGVLNDLPIPAASRSGAAYDTWLDNWYNSARGTVDRPFLVLEIVPYYEQGNFGYLIEGCEPVALERMTGNGWMDSLKGYSTLFKVTQATGNIYFFTDEAEGQQSYYLHASGDYKIDDWNWNNTNVKKEAKVLFGYYECVEEGKGYFRIDEVDGKKKIVKADNASVDKKGTLNWHTVNDYLKTKWEANGYKEGVSYKKYKTLEEIQGLDGSDIDDFISNIVKIDQVGSRYFTTRTSSSEDPYVDVTGKLYDYSNNDAFAKTAIGLTPEQAKTYSIWVKTITPVELNENPQWADIADLVFVQRYNHDTTFTTLFGAKDKSGAYFNRLKKQYYSNCEQQSKSVFSGTYESTDYPGYNGKAKDISWTVAAKLFERTASAKNYCGLVFDKTFRDGIDSPDSKTGIQFSVYDLNDNKITSLSSWTGEDKAYYCNIGKLWTMCVSSKPNLVWRFYKNKLEGESTTDPNYNIGVFKASTNRSADERKYWSSLSFYFASSVYPGVQLSSVDNSTTYWEDYSGYFNTTKDVTYVHGHVYTYNGNQSLFQTFNSGTTGAKQSRFKSFDEYLKTNARTREIWELPENKALWSAANGGTSADYSKVTTENIAPWAALRYILDLDNDNNPQLIDDIYVLDIEPSVKLDKNSKPVYELDANKVALMVPSISADANIRINSMISGSFIGRNEDLNSTYDLIYIGEDAGGFMTGDEVYYWANTKKANTNNVWKNSVAKAGKERTDFVDDTMDGQVYFHIGDLYTVASDVKGDFMYDVANGGYDYNASNAHTYATGQTTRQPGNDFTSIKVKEIKSYVKAGYPVVAASNLYNDGTYPYVDHGSLLWGLLSSTKTTKNSDGTYTDGIFLNTDVSGIDARVRLRKNSQMLILSTPVKYDSAHKDTSYVPKEGVYGKLQFKVQVPNTSDYSYRVYLDQDRNGKFSSSEVVQKNQLATRTADVTVYVTDGWVGFIQWRIEVYKTANEDARISETGCSAIKAGSGEKNKILALQIVPNNGSDVHLYTHKGDGTKRTDNTSWTNLYDFCTDFEIEVYEVKFSEFEKFFRQGVNGDGASYGFSYDMAKDINVSDTEPLSNTNPRRDIVELVEKQTEHEALKNKYLGGHTLSEFNMIVIGFKDSYGSQDFSNKYGCAEYLFYFADKGRSILFTHDLAHYRNRLTDEIGRAATSMLRDIIGMNRYGVVNYRLINDISADVNFNADKSGKLAKSLAAYNAKKGIPFETSKDQYKQGYTFANLMSKVGQSAGGDRRSMYKYVMVKAEKDTDSLNMGNGGNINNNLAETNKVKRLNEGQITQYPFNIDEVLEVNKTHYQYYQLNMEDPQLTVWYTLEAANVYGGSGTNHQLYAVLPQEAANNYYIYSKGNIFYSGVGHSGISGDPERKLFVNTLIAAYRPTLQEPEVIVTNPEATRNGKKYTIRVEREFNYDKDGNLLPMSDALTGTVDVFFIPRDYSGSPTLKCRIYYEGETQFYGGGSDEDYYIYEAKLDADGKKVAGNKVNTVVTGGADHTYLLTTEKEYVIRYKKSRLGTGDAANHIIFEAKNDRVEAPSLTDLYFKPRPMFILD